MTTTKFDFTNLIADRVPVGSLPAHRPSRPKYDFGTGYPDPDSFPAEGLVEALGRALKDHGRDMVLYPHLQGHPDVREFVAEKLRRYRSMDVDPSQIVMTGGSGPALAMFTQMFTNPGDTLLTENFVYSGTLHIMNSFNANIVGVAMDEEGMRPDALEQSIQNLTRQGKPPKFVYTIPSFQNPVGSDMGSQRRQDILAVAQKHGVPVFEDDCYEDLRFEGARTPAIHSYDESESVLYCGTFSKILAAGMRVGYMVAPKELIPRIIGMHYGRPISQFATLAALYYLRDNMDQHIAELCDIFKSRRDTMLGAIGEYMGSSVITSQPGGGMYLWLRLPEGTDVATVAPRAREQGVAYTPGPTYSPTGDGHNYLRLCYGYENHQSIREGVAKLAEIFQKEGVLK